MGLTLRLAALAVKRPHALLVEVPGFELLRIAVERAVLTRGGRIATSPADADILAVCGPPGRTLAEVVDQVWDQLPGPRVQMDVESEGRVQPVLDDVLAELMEIQHHREDADGRGAVSARIGRHGQHGKAEHDGHSEHNGRARDDGWHSGHNVHAGHGGHDDMDMNPHGIPLASGAEDRDGLEMDELHVPLGPVLPHWPGGVVLRCRLHGDVVSGADLEVLDVSNATGDGVVPAPTPVHRCDGLARFLGVAGWDDAATLARRARDAAIDGDAGHCAELLGRLRRRIRRSWSARWMLRGLAPLHGPAIEEYGLSSDLRGDVHDRLVALVDRAERDLRGDAINEGRPGSTLTILPMLVTGLDLAAARLAVASVDPEPAAARTGAIHA